LIMKLNYLKQKNKSVSTFLLSLSVLLCVLILIAMGGFLVTVARAKIMVSQAIERNEPNTEKTEEYLAASREVVDELKDKNLFAPPPPKKNPVTQVSGTMGDEVRINGRWYKVGEKVGDATIVSIEPTKVTVEWDGREQVFDPIDSASSPNSPQQVVTSDGEREGGRRRGGFRGGRRGDRGDRGDRGEGRRREGGRGSRSWGMFGNMSDEEREQMRERMSNMSREERREYFRRMREQRGAE